MNLFQLAKESQLNTKNQIVVGTGSKKHKEYYDDIMKENKLQEVEI